MEQREIKFRCWHNGKMIYQGELVEDKGLHPFYATPDFMFRHISGNRLMQYTGLKDKNGEEVYEGDIVKCHDHPTGASDTIGKVYWKDGKWMVTWSMVDLGDYGTAWIEIIGNICQNPELLNQ